MADDPNELSLNAVALLTRREIEAQIVAPLVDALADEFGREWVLEILRGVIRRVAREQGEQLARTAGGCTLAHFVAALSAWKKGDAMQMEVLEQSSECFAFNATRCRYAEMYDALGIPELGLILSCSRDFALVEGFNPKITLTRTQTILEGAPYCDFRFVMAK